MKEFFLGLAIGLMSMMAVTCYIGHSWHSHLEEDGYGEYYLDENNNKQFRMLDVRLKAKGIEIE